MYRQGQLVILWRITFRLLSFDRVRVIKAPDSITSRIVLFVPSFEKGGVERNAVFFANAIVERGFDLTLLYCRKQEGWFDRLDSNVEVFKVGGGLRFPGVHERITDAVKMIAFAPLALFRMKRKQRLALISFQSNVVAIVLAKLLFLPVAVRLSNHYSSIDNEKSLLRTVSELGKKLFYRWADIVVANSSELAKDYAEILGREVITIHNPIDFDLIDKLRNEEVAEDIFSNKKHPIVIGAGRLSKQKNFELLIKAMAEVVKDVPCDLVIIGEGAERERLKALVSKLNLVDHVHLIGHRSNPYKYFNGSDLFVLSSKYEGMPNVLIEAIACGLPAVSTRCQSGPSEILMNGAGGNLVELDDVAELAGAIKNCLIDASATEAKRQVAAVNCSSYDMKIVFSAWESACLTLFRKDVDVKKMKG